jgi:hypothetical protein
MSGILGTHMFDLWRGQTPAAIKSTVELIYRPGQAVAAAKILPDQSHGSDFEAIAFTAAVDGHATADGYRASIGSVLALTYAGEDYGDVLLQDVTVIEVAAMIHAAGIHPDGTPYNYTPASRITSRWSIVRLS